jgi:hypothetical protein
MKKIFIAFSLVFSIFFCIMLTMACDDDDDIGLGSVPTPENIFNGGEWEYKYIGSDDIVLLHIIISFTDKNFVYNEAVNYWQDKSSTYTGTYSLTNDHTSGMKILTLVSSKPSLNGQVFYIYYPVDTDYGDGFTPMKAGDLFFYGHEPHDLNIPALLHKIN